jgi:hypothetical protein
MIRRSFFRLRFQATGGMCKLAGQLLIVGWLIAGVLPFKKIPFSNQQSAINH